MKRIYICCLIFAFITALCSAKTEQFSQSNYSITINYNDQTKPGDAVFIKMKIDNPKNRKKNFIPSAKAEIFNNEGKSTGTSLFYPLSSKKTSVVLLTGIPLSSWTEDGEYKITVAYKFDNEKEKTLALPLKILKKEFNSGVIELTQNMSNISSNTSPEKVEQSKKLNDIINSINTENIFNLKKFIPPVTSKRRTTSFAERIIYKYPSGKENTSLHNGIDFGKPNPNSAGHMDIVAPADGKIVMAENRIATGWTIIIEHLPGFYSMYYHLNELKVKVGQIVKQGELLGISGSTGFSTGEHLHWELRLNSMIVNPDFFIENNYSFEK